MLGTLDRHKLSWKKTPKELHECMLQTLNDKWPSYSAVKKWRANFRSGDFETEELA